MTGLRGRVAREAIAADVVVIGGGLAGAAAALAARRSGRSVAVIRRSWGGTALSHGVLDLARDPLAAPHAPLGERRSVAASIGALALRRPRHPWAVLGARLPDLARVLGAAGEETDGRLVFADLEAENRCLLTPLGAIKTTAGGQDTVLAGDLLRGGAVGVVGFVGHPAWDARLLAAAANEAAGAAGLRCTALPIETRFLQRADDYALRPHQLAQRIASDPDGLAEAIRLALPAGVERLLLPPLLGTGDPRPIRAALEEKLGLPCAELPAASAAPLPGLRLQQMLEALLEARGVQLWHGEVFSRDGTPGALFVRAAAPPLLDPSHFDAGRAPVPHEPPAAHRVRARAVVLATGRFVGGGIRGGAALREPVFDLPVEGDARAGEAIFAAGVRIDERLRPLDRDGAVRAPGLFACGAVIGGNDPARDGAGLGLSWFTGWLAGEAAAAGGA